MYCPNCGSELPDGSIFCSECGAKIENENPKMKEDTMTGVPEVIASVNSSNGMNNGITRQMKNGSSKKIIGIVTVAVIAILAVLGLKTLFSGSGESNAYAYLSDGTYELITNLNKDQTIEIASSKSDSAFSSLLAFSPDGKYIYYYTKYDSSYGTGSLCRAEYGKLKANSDKNEKYIDIIATNVLLGFQFLDDGTVIYENSNDNLYYYNGEESVQIADDVNYYYLDGSGKIAYSTGDYYEGYTLYGVDISDIDTKLKLASNYSYVFDASDLENILYVKYEDDNTETLYVVGFEKQVEKLAEDITMLTQIDGRTYFIAENGTTLSLYDFVEDPYAETDAGIEEPSRADFSIPAYSYEKISGSDLSESNFDELYTSCTKDLYWYGESYWWNTYSMETAVYHNWGDNSEQIVAATQNFIDKYADLANEDGYILVTDEVKAALQEIQNSASGSSDDEWKWLWLCYNKYQSGTTTDYDAYNAAYNEWSEASSRISMRETLQNEVYDFALNTLYCYDGETLKAVNENVLYAGFYSGGIMFNTSDMITETVAIENVYSVYDVRDLLYFDYEDENYIVLADGSVCRMSSDAAETYAEAYYNSTVTLYFSDKEVFLSDIHGTLSVASISNGVVNDFTIVSDDADSLFVYDSDLYYTCGYYQNNGKFYCDLYLYSNGTSTRLARDIILEESSLYSDGVILAYSGYRSGSGYELTMINTKGETTLIADDVTQYIRVDKSTLLYISDDDLYLYNGKERSLIKSDVDWFWSQNSMDILPVFNWYE